MSRWQKLTSCICLTDEAENAAKDTEPSLRGTLDSQAREISLLRNKAAHAAQGRSTLHAIIESQVTEISTLRAQADAMAMPQADMRTQHDARQTTGVAEVKSSLDEGDKAGTMGVVQQKSRQPRFQDSWYGGFF
jgi:hypothetical protein